MPPRIRTQSAGRPTAESLGRGTGVRVGRGGRGRRPREGNDERVDELNGHGNDQVSNRGNVGNQNGDVVNENVQENVRNVIVNGNRVGCSYKDFLACNHKEYDGKGGDVVLTRWIEKLESVHNMSGCSIDQKVKYTAGSFVGVKNEMLYEDTMHCIIFHSTEDTICKTLTDSTSTTAASGIHIDNTCFNEAAPTPNVAATSPENIPHSKPVSFASILNSEQVNKKVNFRSFVNEERMENSYTVLPKAAMESVKNRYVNSLVGYFVGKSLAFPVVRNYVNNTWGKFGLQKVMRNDDGVFMFKFASKECLDQVLQRGPWMIRKSPIILNKWSFGLSLKKGEVTSVPGWVKLRGVPILAYSEDGLQSNQFCPALIEVSSESELKPKVTMAIPNEEGDGYTKEVIRVEYEWKPPHCGDSKIFGHDLLQCPKHVKETVFNDPSKVGTSTSTDTSSDGFTEVTRKKNKGTQADQQLRSRHIDGIRLNKPKPNFYWQKKGTNKSGANLGSKGQMGTNSSNNKGNGPSASISFPVLNKVDVGDECGNI
ncbi:hypothetical protein Tco_0492838 [Tanacetum coccineum]